MVYVGKGVCAVVFKLDAPGYPVFGIFLLCTSDSVSTNKLTLGLIIVFHSNARYTDYSRLLLHRSLIIGNEIWYIEVPSSCIKISYSFFATEESVS